MTERLIRLLVRLAPRRFRDTFGHDFLETLRVRRQEPRVGGWWRRAVLDVREIAGALLLVLRLRGDARAAQQARPAVRSAVTGDVLRDVRYGARTLIRSPTYAITAVLVLGVGLGASVAIFSAANAFLLRPLPFADAGRLVMLYETNPEFGWSDAPAAPANVLDWRERVSSFADVAGFNETVAQIPVLHEGEPILLKSTAVTGNFFAVLGVPALHGRTFTWEETWGARSDVVVLSHALWMRRFGSDPGVIGRTIDLGTTRAQVVGVAPPGFSFPSSETELWRPWGWAPDAAAQSWFRRAHFVRAFARLAPSATLSVAAAELGTVVRQLQGEYPETNRVMGAGLMPVRDFLIRDAQRPLLVLLGAVALLLLLACANIANLTLVRGAGRTRELALRHALGAGRVRVIRQLLTESLLLAFAGGIIGLAAGWSAVRALQSMTTLGIDGATSIALDYRVLAFAFGATLFSVVLFGLAPALRSTAAGLHTKLVEGGTGASAGRSRLRLVGALVVAEVALAVMLVMAAALMTRSVTLMRNVDPGFDVDGALAVRFTVPSARYADRDAVLDFQDRFTAALEARTGIERAGIVGQLPLAGTSWSSQFQARGWPPERVGNEILHRRADAGYFEALGVPLLRGRMFDARDGADAPLVVLINETFARVHFPGEDPIGQWIAYDRVATDSSVWYQVIGVVGDQHQESVALAARAEAFENRRQDWARTNWFVMRTSQNPAAMVATARAVLHELDPLIPLAEARPLREVWRRSMEREEFLLTLLGVFGVAALLLATVGVYAVTAQAARVRTREIGIRLALGAASSSVAGMMLRQSLLVVVVGLAAGLAVTLLASRALRGLLFGIAPHDPFTIGAVLALLLATSAAACYLPVRRVLRSDPVRALKDA